MRKHRTHVQACVVDPRVLSTTIQIMTPRRPMRMHRISPCRLVSSTHA